MTAPDASPQWAERLLFGLAERLGAQLAATRVFGDPVEREGVTVVPVAAVRVGLGGGAGGEPGKDQEVVGGGGGGGGGWATPVGYIEIRDGASRFVPVVHPARVPALVVAAILAGVAIARPWARG